MHFRRLQWEPRHLIQVQTPIHSCDDFYHECQQGSPCLTLYLIENSRRCGAKSMRSLVDAEQKADALCALTGCWSQITTPMTAIVSAQLAFLRGGNHPVTCRGRWTMLPAGIFRHLSTEESQGNLQAELARQRQLLHQGKTHNKLCFFQQAFSCNYWPSTGPISFWVCWMKWAAW